MALAPPQQWAQQAQQEAPQVLQMLRSRLPPALQRLPQVLVVLAMAAAMLPWSFRPAAGKDRRHQVQQHPTKQWQTELALLVPPAQPAPPAPLPLLALRVPLAPRMLEVHRVRRARQLLGPQQARPLQKATRRTGMSYDTPQEQRCCAVCGGR